MEFKKCERCGCFFLSQDNVCQNCITKDRAEINRLKNYFDINPNVQANNLNDLSLQMGISEKNLNRYMQNKDLEISNILNKYLDINL